MRQRQNRNHAVLGVEMYITWPKNRMYCFQRLEDGARPERQSETAPKKHQAILLVYQFLYRSDTRHNEH